MIRSIIFAALVAMGAMALRADMVDDFYGSPAATAVRIDSIIASTPADSLESVMEEADRRFFQTDSPEYCEGLYALYLQAALPRLEEDSTEREVALWKLNEICLVNAEGSPAPDFRFDLADGPRNLSLSRYLKGKPLAIVFYDPDCRHCQVTIRELAGLGERVNVLAVCVESTEARWEETRGALPDGWARAFDRSDMPETEIYRLRSLPSVYLLDADHNIVFKNPTPRRLLQYLDQQ